MTSKVEIIIKNANNFVQKLSTLLEFSFNIVDLVPIKSMYILGPKAQI